MTVQVFKGYKIVAAPYVPDGPVGPQPGRYTDPSRLTAQRAEHRLRTELAAGRVPDAVELVALEMGTPAEIGPVGPGPGGILGGAVHDVHVWDMKALTPPHSQVLGRWMRGGVYVTATLDVEPDDMTPDHAPEIAAAGAWRIRRGVITRFRLSRMFAPLAAPLARRYGIPVDVNPVGRDPFVVPEASPVVLRELMAPQGAAALRAWIDEHEDDPQWSPGPRRPGNAAVVEIPPAARLPFLDVAQAVGEQLQLPVTGLSVLLLARYGPGDAIDWHRDFKPSTFHTYDRTVSFSLMLSRPGVDFQGGELRTADGVADLQLGDALGFTCTTRHAVDPITEGRRHVLIGFGDYDGWSDA